MSRRFSRSMFRPASTRGLPSGVKLALVLVSLSVAMSAAMAVMADTASLTVPSEAAPGQTIEVSGGGFDAGQAGDLTFNGEVVAQFATDSEGTFSVPFTIPTDSGPGTGRISAKSDNDTDVLATTTLAIGGDATGDSSLLTPGLASPGSTITVSGSGFGASQSGNLTYNGSIVTTFTAADDGSFSVPFTVPSGADPGTGRISAKNPDSSLIATTTLEVAARVDGGPTPEATPEPTPGSTPPPTPTSTDQPVVTPAPTPTAGPQDTPTPQPTPQPTAQPTAAPTPAPTPAPGGHVPAFSHVYVIVMENKEYSSIVGSSQAPYINSLIAQYGIATSDYAIGHPSEPNYIALTSGGTQGVHDDGVYNLGASSIFDQIEASGRTWRAYEQGYPGNCFTGSSASGGTDGIGQVGGYVRKHDPAISYTSISGNPTRCANIVSLAGFDPAAADFEFITPNLINDMHDGSIQDGDSFLKAFVPRITGSSAFANSVVLITWDEGSSGANGGGHVATIAITPKMTAGFQATGTYSHYSLLRTIEQAWGLPLLGGASSAASLAFPY